MDSGQRSILIAVHQAFSTRYLLDADILSHLKSKDVQVIILSPNADDPKFREAYEDPKVTVEKYEYAQLSKITKSRLCQFFIKVRSLTLPGEHDIGTIKFLETMEALNKSQASFVGAGYLTLVLLTAKVLRRSHLLRRLFALVEARLFRSNVHDAVFGKYRPSLMVTADVGTHNLTNLLMAEAKRHGVPVASVVLSWDNLTSQGMGGTLPDYAIAWNQSMKEDLEKYHNLQPSHIFVGGIAHFRDYYRDVATISRTEFLLQSGLSPERRTLFLALASPSMFRRHVDLIKTLLHAIQAGLLAEPSQLLVRFHPAHLTKWKDKDHDERTQIERLQAGNSKLIALSVPQTAPYEDSELLAAWDQRQLAVILKHSDVIINIFSTLMLEASIWDLPVVNVAFHNFRDTHLSNKQLKEFTHVKRMIDSGAVRTAHSEQELLDLINMYLVDPTTDHAQRMMVRDLEGGPHKGYAGEAIADHLYELAGLAAR